MDMRAVLLGVGAAVAVLLVLAQLWLESKPKDPPERRR